MAKPLFATGYIEDADRFLATPSHALLLTGPAGAGKGTALRYLASKLLVVSDITDHPAVLTVAPDELTIGIDDVRAIQHFLTLKTSGESSIRRIVLIEDAFRMSTAAQNALLKAMEEPPADTIMLLSAVSTQQLLPTVVSRVQEMALILPANEDVKAYFLRLGSPATVSQAMAFSGGLPGLTAALVNGATDHPVLQAVEWCRKLLSTERFERLAMVDELSKQRELAMQICDVLSRMATVALRKAGLSSAQAQRWRTVLDSSLHASEQLRGHANPKLALSALCLHI